MELDEHENEMEEEEEIPPLQPHQPVYATAGGEAAATSSASRKPPGGGGPGGSFRYRECLKNHAVGIGGNAVDGCGEFMAAGEEGTLDALRCAACGCHRNFHRRESDPEVGVGGGSLVYHQFSPYYRAAPPPSGYLHVTPATLHRPLALPAVSGGGHSREELEDASNPSSSGGGGGGSRMMMMKKKRSRTKFTAEQKEKMLGFAERLGWRLQRHDEAEVEQFCTDTGVKRHVLKVWMHNNKNTFGKKTT